MSNGAHIERTAVSQPLGEVIAVSGGFPEKPVDEPCEPPPEVAPVDVQSGGTIHIELDGAPAVPCQWSLYNGGTAVSVDYLPPLGQAFGPPQRLSELALTCVEMGEGSAHLEATAEVPGPGRLQVSVGAPAGGGPLTSSCFAQSFSASVEMVEARADLPARDGMSLHSGDRLTTDPGGFAIVQIAPSTSLLVHSDIEIESYEPQPAIRSDTLALGTPVASAYSKMQHWLIDYSETRLLQPINNNFDEYKELTQQAAANMVQANDACEGGLEATLFLNTKQGQWTAERLANTAWTLFGKDEYDLLQAVVELSFPPLLPVAVALGAVDDAQDWAGVIQKAWQERDAGELWTPALAAWQESRGETKAQVEARIDALHNERRRHRRSGARTWRLKPE